jgi:plastocyanin
MKGTVKEFTVTGKSFSFTPNELKVKKGDTVKITFKNNGGFHDWVIDEFNARTKQIGDGEIDTVEFTADKAGTFEFYCSVGNHRQMGMVGNLIVE